MRQNDEICELSLAVQLDHSLAGCVEVHRVVMTYTAVKVTAR